MHTLSIATYIAFLASTTYAGFSSDSKSNVAVYWGQNSYGQSSGDLAQQRLSYYCENTDFDVIVMSFLTRINGQGGQPELNFANQGDLCEVFSGTNLLDCAELAADIPTCQSQGKTILLSIGGATYTEGGFQSESAAIEGAQMVWDIFGPMTSTSGNRPFGNASIDGFDFDFEAGVQNMVPFANKLRSLMDTERSREFILTAAPQCPYPDSAMNAMLDGAVSFDALLIQFYNNYCGLQSYQDGAADQSSFNMKQWNDWATQTSKNKDVKILLGMPANTGAAGSGYVTIDKLRLIIGYCKQFSNFGGAMMWDMTQAYANKDWLQDVKSALTSNYRRFFA
ncbi:chitinase 4 [Pseudovirgaria hyperparasitica]|uniref:chitinase n=1 Tax=Pseudovirgaria hyperparasitica TaxID=470096 RepID=A0A6A6WF20_9PEZI|nr:chitinase 4 [Pseudovirgaria hyperparasitica]KAF2760580.1 chitinase 4 [Pseudovirgaria hyperparasitica]